MGQALKGTWGVVLGASSGFGAAACRALAGEGMGLVGIHLDRKNTMPQVDELVAELKKTGAPVHFHNMNAADEEKRREVLSSMEGTVAKNSVRLLFHSLAFGALKPFAHDDPAQAINKSQLEMTLDVMANSLVYWAQDLVRTGFLGRGGKILAMTSAGSQRVWLSYGAVSAAKAALETHIRQLAVELAPRGIAANALRAGATDTPSLRKIPGHEEMLKIAGGRNPGGRITTPEDVAGIVKLFCQDPGSWMTGNVINVDGGEFLT